MGKASHLSRRIAVGSSPGMANMAARFAALSVAAAASKASA